VPLSPNIDFKELAGRMEASISFETAKKHSPRVNPNGTSRVAALNFPMAASVAFLQARIAQVSFHPPGQFLEINIGRKRHMLQQR